MEKVKKIIKINDKDLYDEEDVEKDLDQIKKEYAKVSKLIDFFILALMLLFVMEMVF